MTSGRYFNLRRRFFTVPCWVFEGGSRIERYALTPPMSHDEEHMEGLRRSLAVYRMVFGQPRQEDLVAYLAQHHAPDEIKELCEELRLDLSPPWTGPELIGSDAPS
jgi:hypothetical protein